MVALHLAETLPPEQNVLLCERDTFACGAAYATGHAGHLLNVRAANMSAFPDQPAHFSDWLETVRWECPEQMQETEAGLFASRGLYRRYLCSLLDRAVAGVPGRLGKLAAEIVDIERDGGAWRLHTAGGASYRVAAVVLAIGNLPPAAPENRLHRTDPWASGTTKGLRPDLPVLVLGTGMTMVDLLLELRAAGFPGPVIAVSRRGLLPHRHAATRPWATPEMSDTERGSLALLLGRVRWEVQRAAARGVDWRGVLDSLRPITAAIWRSLSPADRNRFLRHLRPYWDVHRHRLAAPVAEQMAEMLASGYLQVRRGRLTGMNFAEDRVEALIRPHGKPAPEPLLVQRVISATGLQSAADADSPLVRALCRRGLARLDPWSFGLDVTETLEVRDSGGRVAGGLWALGPIVRGVFWECIAVPDVRVQAQTVARRIGEAIGGAAARAA